MNKKLDPLNAFIHSVEECGNISNRLKIAVKDNIAVKGWPLSCASKSLEGYVADYDATCISHIKTAPHRYELVGKCNLDEFAMGSNNLHSYFGRVKHPKFPDYSPGGSSGGSAVAIASGMADLALGSDTGGSVRLPASYCGVIGFKGSYGAVSRNGLVPYAPSLDTIGILGRSLPEIKELFSLINQECQYDPKYQPVQKQPMQERSTFKFGTLSAFKRNPPHIEEILNGSRSLDIPFSNSLLPIYYVTALSEAASSLSRYKVDNPFHNLNQEVSRSSMFGEQVRKRIILGTAIKSQQIDSYFHAQRLRLILKEALFWIFQTVDILVLPTTLSPPPRIDECEKGGGNRHEFDQDEGLVLANLVGIPALSIPLHPTNRIEDYQGIK